MVAQAYIGVQAEGALTFEWRDAGGTRVSETVLFTVDVAITPPEGLGAGGFDPTGDYTLALRTKGAGYRVVQAISQPLAPKSFDRFILWVGAERSSRHRMRVVLRYNEDEEVRSPAVELDYLMPRANRLALDGGDGYALGP